MQLREIEREHGRLHIPRTLTDAFGPTAKLTVLDDRNVVREAMAYVGYIAAGLLIGGVVSTALYWGYKAICWCLS